MSSAIFFDACFILKPHSFRPFGKSWCAALAFRAPLRVIFVLFPLAFLTGRVLFFALFPGARCGGPGCGSLALRGYPPSNWSRLLFLFLSL